MARADLLSLATERCTRVIFLNPGIEACVENCRRRPWEPHKYATAEEQDANLHMLIDWVREYETREDVFSLRSHRELFDEFDGEKEEHTSNVHLPYPFGEATKAAQGKRPARSDPDDSDPLA